MNHGTALVPSLSRSQEQEESPVQIEIEISTSLDITPQQISVSDQEQTSTTTTPHMSDYTLACDRERRVNVRKPARYDDESYYIGYALAVAS